MELEKAKALAIASVENSRELLGSADAVYEEGNVGHAFGLLTLCAEELAKAWKYSEIVIGRVTFEKTDDRYVSTLKESDFSNHKRKDVWFAEMVIQFTLLPLIVRTYWVTRGSGSPAFEGFDPEDYQSFAEFYTNMDPGVAASLLDGSGLAAKRMDLLTSLSLRIGSDKNDAFYVDSNADDISGPSDVKPGDYLGLKETIEWLYSQAEKSIREAEPRDPNTSLADALRRSLTESLGPGVLHRD